MLEANKLFIQRHMAQLVQQPIESEELLIKSLTILDDDNYTDNALATLKKSASLTATLSQLGLIDLDEELVNKIIDLEKSSPLKRPNLNAMLGINQIVEASFQLLKTRLSMGLSYALWLSVFAASTFATISLKVLPQFEQVYSEFGAQLPELTKIALSWQHSFFSPNLIGLLLVCSILMLLLVVRKISKDPYSKRSSLLFKVMQRMPIISPVFNISHAIFWMGHLKILTSAGLSLKQSLETLTKPPNILERKSSQVFEQLEVAEKIDNLPIEIDYQSEQLQSNAEAIVSRASRNLVAFILVLVMSFIVFTIFATYLPIFQLGEAI